MLFLVGHVTKEGNLAGPKVLEHMNRLFHHARSGNESRYRASARAQEPLRRPLTNSASRHDETGLKKFATLPRSSSPGRKKRRRVRPWSLCGKAPARCWSRFSPGRRSQLGNPRRVAVGLEHNRLAMLLAVLHRHGGLFMADQDVFVNVVGGVKVSETSADLALLLAVVSSFRDRPLPRDLVVFGEVGLAGEIRPVPGGQERLREAAKHGFRHAIAPGANTPRKPIAGLEIHAVTNVSQALEAVESLTLERS